MQSMVIFFHDPATQQVIRNNRESFQRVASDVRELRLYMSCTARLKLLRKPLEDMAISGQRIQSIVDSLRKPARMHATQRSRIWFMPMARFDGWLRLVTHARSETRLAYLRKPLQDVIISGRQVQVLTNGFREFEFKDR